MVKNKAKTRRRDGFTLVEIMIAAICLTIILGPIFLILRSGTDTSLKGMMRIDTTLKARTILQQVYADLKMACFPLPYGSQYSFDDLLRKEGTVPNYVYSFNSFPIHQDYDAILESQTSGINYRNTSKITYRVENGNAENLNFKKLIREETFEGKTTKTVLSENVNFFEIKEILMEVDGKDQFYYLITLQLIDVLHASDMKDKKSGEKLRENQKDVILADFYDIVYPEYFHALWNDKKLNPNWHTQLKGATIDDSEDYEDENED